jgi:hypothetical protein
MYGIANPTTDAPSVINIPAIRKELSVDMIAMLKVSKSSLKTSISFSDPRGAVLNVLRPSFRTSSNIFLAAAKASVAMELVNQ